MKNGVILAILSSLVFSMMNELVMIDSSTEVIFFRILIVIVLIYLMMKQSKVAFLKETCLRK